MEKERILDEYLTKVDILNDFWTHAKKARESYYYLKALKEMFINEAYEESLADKINKHKNELETVINEFLKIDHKCLNDVSVKAYPYSQKAKLDNLDSLDENNIVYIEDEDFLNYLIKFIEIKSKMDNLQIDILKFFLENLKLRNKFLIDKFPELSNMCLIHEHEKALMFILKNSHEEDKIETFEINSSNSNLNKSYKKKDIVLPITLRVQNYEYPLERFRELFDKEYLFSINLLKKTEDVTNKRKVDILNKRINFLNIIVAILTILTAIDTIAKWFL